MGFLDKIFKNQTPIMQKTYVEIDQLVYKLYNLTPEEIMLIEKS